MQKKANISKEKPIPAKKPNSQRAPKSSAPHEARRGSKLLSASPVQTLSSKKRTKVKKPSKPVVSHPYALSDSDSSVDSQSIPTQTAQIKDQVMSSLAVFKAATSNYMKLNNSFEEAITSFQADFIQVKHEVQEVYKESSMSKQDISKIRKRITDSPMKAFNISTKNSPGTISYMGESNNSCFTDAQERLNSLRKEISELKDVVNKTEEEMKNEEYESMELRTIAFKLQDTIDHEEDETPQKLATCKSCRVF